MIASMVLNLCLSFTPALPPSTTAAPEAIEMEAVGLPGNGRSRWRRYHRGWRHGRNPNGRNGHRHGHHHRRKKKKRHRKGHKGNSNPTPEPISLSFMALAGLGFLARKRRKDFLDLQD